MVHARHLAGKRRAASARRLAASLCGLETPMNEWSALIRVLALTAVLTGCAGSLYVLPVADGGSAPSPPALQGRISAIGDNELVVEGEASSGVARENVTIHLGPRTELFSAYGGVVTVSDLMVGQRVRIWFNNPGLPRDGKASPAAVVMLASKDPNGDWP